MSCIMSIRVDHEKTLNTAVYNCRFYQKKIDQLRKKAYFEESFPMREVTAKFGELYETLRSEICRA